MTGGVQEEVSEVISPFGRSSRVAEGPQLPRTDCLLSVPRKAGKTSDTVTFSPVARSREGGSQRKFPTQVSTYASIYFFVNNLNLGITLLNQHHRPCIRIQHSGRRSSAAVREDK